MGRIRPLPRPVKMKKAGQVIHGRVIDEVQLEENYPGNEDFIDLIQLIEWKDGGHTIRICYYVKPHDAGEDGWTFANRPLSIGIDELKKLLKQASKKEWFKFTLP